MKKDLSPWIRCHIEHKCSVPNRRLEITTYTTKIKRSTDFIQIHVECKSNTISLIFTEQS